MDYQSKYSSSCSSDHVHLLRTMRTSLKATEPIAIILYGLEISSHVTYSRLESQTKAGVNNSSRIVDSKQIRH